MEQGWLREWSEGGVASGAVLAPRVELVVLPDRSWCCSQSGAGVAPKVELVGAPVAQVVVGV